VARVLQGQQARLRLYEIARSTWRAQIQTIIPLTLQKRRAGEGYNNEKEVEEEEEGGGAA
jgi:hypothetical protein